MESKDASPHMWEYWRDKYGTEDALKEYYPSIAQKPIVQRALENLKLAELALEAAVRENLPEWEDYNDE